MNYMRKRAAVKKYTPLKETDTVDEIKVAISADESGYDKDEIAEIIEEIMTEKPPEKINADTDKPADRNGRLAAYYKHKVEAKFETIGLRGKKEQIMKGYKKVGDCLQVTHLEDKHAEVLNQQTPNTLVYFFKAEDPEMIPAELFF